MADLWRNVMSVMTPDNLDEFGISNYNDIANCLGVGLKYQVGKMFAQLFHHFSKKNRF